MPPGDPKKMNPAIALPSPRRFSDLLSSGLRSRAKPKRDVEQPRSDEDATGFADQSGMPER